MTTASIQNFQVTEDGARLIRMQDRLILNLEPLLMHIYLVVLALREKAFDENIAKDIDDEMILPILDQLSKQVKEAIDMAKVIREEV